MESQDISVDYLGQQMSQEWVLYTYNKDMLVQFGNAIALLDMNGLAKSGDPYYDLG